MIRKIFVLYFCIHFINAVVFDYYTASIATEEQLKKYEEMGNLDVCTIDIEPCCETDRKRVDGSCNSVEQPARGTFFVPPIRVLPALYYNGSYARKAVSGEDLELPRVIRRILLSEGKASDRDFTHLMTSFAAFMFGDIGSIHDILFFLINRTDCCAGGRNDYQCAPNIVPKDDPIHRMTGITCLNLTRPLTHQFFGCTDDPIPSPVNMATSLFDLSLLYNILNGGDKAVRSFVSGQLAIEVEDDKIWPPTGGKFCPLNEADETRCFKNYPNMLMTVTLFVVWFVRLHNYYASQLEIVNPHWDDETLFQVARDMNIACTMQIFLHEWLAQLEGHENLVKAGVISEDPGYRDVYDCTKLPHVTLEYSFILRWFHIVQESTGKMYDTDGTYLKDFAMFNLTFRPGFLAKDKNMEYITQGHFRQPSGKFDQSIDLEVANNGIPGLQRSVDLPTSDLHKGRLIGLRPYIDYLFYCTGHNVTSFDDLARHVSKDQIFELQKCYKDVRDIDLMAGMWVEKYTVGGKLPRTLACLINDNIFKSIQADRHWYESSTRPHAFTERQLQEIRKASLAYVLCTVGDSVTEVQRKAFRTISLCNPLMKCEDIPKIDITAWTDPDCSYEEYAPYHR